MAETGAGGGADAPASSCSVGPGGARLGRHSRVIAYDGAGWEGVRVEAYKEDERLFEGVTRRVLAAPRPAGFEVRYFELDAGGHSTHEHHEHVHVVVCLRGCGSVRASDEVYDVGFGDVVYIAPGEAHQFRNPYNEPFGFLCVVDRDRDEPTPIEE